MRVAFSQQLVSYKSYVIVQETIILSKLCLLKAKLHWYIIYLSNTDMRHLTTGMLSEKCAVRRFHGCANVIDCRYTKPR
jgi:hypothetical protein